VEIRLRKCHLREEYDSLRLSIPDNNGGFNPPYSTLSKGKGKL